MRGSKSPAVRPMRTESQAAFGGLSRHRRTRLARAAQTNLVKADQWGRGEVVAADVAAALDTALRALQAKSKK